MKNVLLYELSKVRLSILHPSNKLCESKEIELLLELEIAEDSLPLISYDSNYATILDFMVFCQCTTQTNPETFGQLLQILKSSIILSLQKIDINALVP